MVMRTTLSKKEFASALGMSEKDVFVLKMFNIVDRDGDGRISFQEFLDTIVLFSKVRRLFPGNRSKCRKISISPKLVLASTVI